MANLAPEPCLAARFIKLGKVSNRLKQPQILKFLGVQKFWVGGPHGRK